MKPKKSLGQNFLNDTNVLMKIIDIGNISSEDMVLEIGPGTGNLTKEIIKKKPKKIIVIEKDNYLSNILYKKYGNKIEIINKDVLKCFKEFKKDKQIIVFGNLPYNISTKILISFIKLDNLQYNFRKFIFVFQKEVAERIVAKENSKNYGRLSILTSWKMESEKIIDISPEYFYPKPKVWSSLIVLTPKKKYENLDKPSNLEHVTNIFFNQRRKMIKKPMKQLFKNYQSVAKDLKLDLNLRPQNLSKDKFIEICKIYEKLIK
jgi:16S rRNA (adenine1518-N6/adenine1519-N6)-dimethyltransferase